MTIHDKEALLSELLRVYRCMRENVPITDAEHIWIEAEANRWKDAQIGDVIRASRKTEEIPGKFQDDSTPWKQP